jgi:hypothetical protein
MSKDQLRHEDTAPTIRALWNENGIEETRIEREAEGIPYIEENSFEWVGPVIFIGAAVFSSHPHVISLSLSILANYLTDYFKGRPDPRRVKLSIVVPDSRSARHTKIDYDGNIEGLKTIERIVKDIRNGKKLR